MRCDQFVGLNEWASAFIRGDKILKYIREETRFFPNGKVEKLQQEEIYGSSVTVKISGKTYYGMFDVEYPLNKYTFPDGKVYFEEVQAAPWSSGPMFFLALKDEAGKWVGESLWTAEEIEKR